MMKDNFLAGARCGRCVTKRLLYKCRSDRTRQWQPLMNSGRKKAGSVNFKICFSLNWDSLNYNCKNGKYEFDLFVCLLFGGTFLF